MSNDLFNKKKSRFSIRKLNIGVCSVLLCTLVMIGTSAQADENTDTSVSASAPVTALTETTQSLLNTSAQADENTNTSVSSSAPVTASTETTPSLLNTSAAETETPNNESNLVIKTEVGKTTEADVAKEKQKSDEAKKTLELEKKRSRYKG